MQTQYLGPPEKSLGGKGRSGFSTAAPQALGSPLSWPVRHKAANREVTPALEILQERVEDKGRFQNHKILKFLLFSYACSLISQKTT